MSTNLPRTIWDTMASEDPDPSLPRYDDLTEYEQRAFDERILGVASWTFVSVVRRNRRDALRRVD